VDTNDIGDEDPRGEPDALVSEPQDDLIASRASASISDEGGAAGTHGANELALGSPGMRAALDALARQHKIVQDVTSTSAFRTALQLADSSGVQAAANAAAEHQRILNQPADSPVARVAVELARLAQAWQPVQNQTADRIIETIRVIQSACRQIWPWVSTAAEVIGKALLAMYRYAAPPNWSDGGQGSLVDYTMAVALALEEGIPLAWVPDHDTVLMLLAVPAGPDRRFVLRAILADRRAIILDHCDAVLDELADGMDIPATRQRMIEVARQAIQALRADLPAPAQSAAANLADQLLRHLFVPIDGGRNLYRTTSNRVTDLSQQFTYLSVHFLAILREFATLMPVPKSLTGWWPDKGMELPDTFSRHATAHAIAEPGQVNPVNALIAIMLAVSLLCQEAASGWIALGTFVWAADTETHEEGDDALRIV
jgi:hypothetical protein